MQSGHKADATYLIGFHRLLTTPLLVQMVWHVINPGRYNHIIT